ncbi:putative membrane protein [Streptomyces badius]
MPLDEIFVNDAPSVAAQETLGEHFPGGSGNPAVIIAAAGKLAEVSEAATRTDGVASVAPVSEGGRPGGEPLVVDGKVRIDATLKAATATTPRRRWPPCARQCTRCRARTPWSAATRPSSTTPSGRPRTTCMLIVPVVLAIILVILVFLLRSLLMPVLLVATVALNFQPISL